MRKLDLNKVKDYINNQSPETKIYIGCDSERFKVDGVWYADYILAVVVHINGNNGCKLFGEVQRERDYDQKKNRPRYRLMNEVYKVSELYIKLADVLEDRHVEVHLDINPDEHHGSNCVMQEAIQKEMLEGNLRFVITVAKQYQNQGIDLSDLIAEGNYGLMKAIKNFDWSKNNRFISYAVWWIK